MEITCFKAYDVRGRIPDELNEDVAFRIGVATADYLNARKIVVGRDIRLSSDSLADAVCSGLIQAGVKVVDIGQCGTEMVYFATAELGACGGIMVTASHNPADYNGLKIVREEARPVSGDSGLQVIRKLAEIDEKIRKPGGRRVEQDVFQPYLDHLLSYVDQASLTPLKIVVNPGNGGAGIVMDRLMKHLPFEFIQVNYPPDGTFPNGIPNPMLIENQAATADAVRESGADLGIAWDGDFDRCFFFDEKGNFIEGYYIVGLLAESILKNEPGGRVIHDPRLIWNTKDIVEASGGELIQSKSGHSFIKEKMRDTDAVYGGEMSAHHYFREFSYADSGMIPWLLVAELMSTTGKPLSALVGERIAMYPASGEINRTVKDANATLKLLYDRYAANAIKVDDVDGYGFDFEDWRFNIRKSNTEPVIRLNVESRADAELMQSKTREILELIEGR